MTQQMTLWAEDDATVGTHGHVYLNGQLRHILGEPGAEFLRGLQALDDGDVRVKHVLLEIVSAAAGSSQINLVAPESFADPKSKRGTIYRFVDRERRYQDLRFAGRPHEIPAWILLVERELEEAKEKWCRADKDEEGARAELLQALAVLVAALEQHGPAEEPNRAKALDV